MRQALARLDADVAEIACIQAETRRIVANFQDMGAHVHARAEGLAEQFRSRYANTERRVARANQRADELEMRLHEAHITISRLEGENKNLRGEMDRSRAELDQLRGEKDRLRGERDRLRSELNRLRGELDVVHGELDQVRGELERVRIQAGKDDVRLNEALKSCQDAIRETELARARWAVVQKKLEDQLAAQKRDAAADKEALLTQIEELKCTVQEAKRQAATLVEEKRQLEVQIQSEAAQRKHSEISQNSRHQQPDQPLSNSNSSGESAKMVAEGKEQMHDSARKPADFPAANSAQQSQLDSHLLRTVGSTLPASLSLTSPPSTVSTLSRSPVSHRPSSAHPTSNGDASMQRRSKGKLLHLADESPARPNINPPNEPLLAVKDEDQDEVKAKIEPVDETPTAFSFTSYSRSPIREQRREQSLDYAPLQQEPPQSPPMQRPAPSYTTFSGFAAPDSAEHSPGSPAVSLGRHSPELAYPSRLSSYEPTLPPREISPAPFAQEPSGQPPAPEPAQTQSDTNPQLTGDRRGPMTPPLENAPSAQAKRLIRRPPPVSQAVEPTALPAPVQPPVQSLSPPIRRGSDSWRPREHEARPQVRYSDETRDRHKRRRDDDADTRQSAARRPRLTPPRGHNHYSHPTNRQTPPDFARRTPPLQLNGDRSHYQPPPPQECQHYNLSPSDDERAYVPASTGNLRRRVDHYSPPDSPQQRTRYSPDVPTTGYAPAREARAAAISDTEPPHLQMAPSLAQRLQGNPDVPVQLHDQPGTPASSKPVSDPWPSAPSKPVPEPRPLRTNGGPPPARRQAKRRTSRSPSPKRPPPATSAQEPSLNASGSVPLLDRFSDFKTNAPASRGRGSGRGRGGRGRGGQPQQKSPADRPQKTLEGRLSTNRNPGGGGDLMDRIQPR